MNIPKKSTNAQNAILLSKFTIEDVKPTLFQMQPNKALGPDALNPCFYQKF